MHSAENEAHKAAELPAWLKIWSDKLEASSSGWLIGDTVTIADLALFTETCGLATPGPGGSPPFDMTAFPSKSPPQSFSCLCFLGVF